MMMMMNDGWCSWWMMDDVQYFFPLSGRGGWNSLECLLFEADRRDRRDLRMRARRFSGSNGSRCLCARNSPWEVERANPNMFLFRIWANWISENTNFLVFFHRIFMKVLAISKDGKETLWILISFEEFKSHPTTDLTRYFFFEVPAGTPAKSNIDYIDTKKDGKTMYLLSNMAILGIHVRFRGCIPAKNVVSFSCRFRNNLAIAEIFQYVSLPDILPDFPSRVIRLVLFFV